MLVPRRCRTLQDSMFSCSGDRARIRRGEAAANHAVWQAHALLAAPRPMAGYSIEKHPKQVPVLLGPRLGWAQRALSRCVLTRGRCAPQVCALRALWTRSSAKNLPHPVDDQIPVVGRTAGRPVKKTGKKTGKQTTPSAGRGPLRAPFRKRVPWWRSSRYCTAYMRR